MNSVKGIIFDIQHFSIHDGPGIRTNVFFKGCPLRCLWCANPESQSPAPEIFFHAQKCSGCGICVSSCPKEAIHLDDGKARTTRALCEGCGCCEAICPNDAREVVGKLVTVEGVYKVVEADRMFYEAAEPGEEPGGITLTGGEVLMQPDFAEALLRKCKENGIHTAVETSGLAPWNTMKRVMEHVDYVMYDIKHMSSVTHKELTGIGNERILSNLERLSGEFSMPIVVRTPVIPGINDTPDNLSAMKKFISERVPRCIKVEFLPYHRLGEGKHELLESVSTFHAEVPSDDSMAQLRGMYDRLLV